MSTVAHLLGGTAHLSPLLRKARKSGLCSADDLLRLAVRRGCRHYTPADYDESTTFDPGLERLSNLEVAIALLSAAQTYDPHYVRCAAQLLGSPETRADALARLAAMERCVPIVRHIAEAALRFDAERQAFWNEVLARMPHTRTVRPGLLPHLTRFTIQTGFVRGRRSPQTLWLRPNRRAER